MLAPPFKGINLYFYLMTLNDGKVFIKFIQTQDAMVSDWLKILEIVERAGVMVGAVGHQGIQLARFILNDKRPISKITVFVVFLKGQLRSICIKHQ